MTETVFDQEVGVDEGLNTKEASGAPGDDFKFKKDTPEYDEGLRMACEVLASISLAAALLDSFIENETRADEAMALGGFTHPKLDQLGRKEKE